RSCRAHRARSPAPWPGSRGAGGGARGRRPGRAALAPRAQGEAHVRPGVAVGDGEDVEAVQLVPAGGDPVCGGEQRAAEPRPVHVADADARAHAGLYSFTTVITTSGRTSAWILMPTRNSPSARIGSGRSMRRLSTCRPSSSSL